jgi:hypothetical protein
MEEEEAPVAFDTFAPLAVGRFVKGADVLDSGALCFDFEMHEGLDRFWLMSLLVALPKT